MEPLRQVLRLAIELKALRIRIIRGELAVLSNMDGSDVLAQEAGSFDQQTFNQLLSFLFPKKSDQTGPYDIQRGLLQVPQIGALQLLAQTDDKQAVIHLYLPAGMNLYTSDAGQQSLLPSRSSSASLSPNPASINTLPPPLPPPPPVSQVFQPSEPPSEPLRMLMTQERKSLPLSVDTSMPIVESQPYNNSHNAAPASQPDAQAPLGTLKFLVPKLPITADDVPGDIIELRSSQAPLALGANWSASSREEAQSMVSNSEPLMFIPPPADAVPAMNTSFPIPESFKLPEVLEVSPPSQSANQPTMPSKPATPTAVNAPPKSIDFGSGSEEMGSLSHGENPIDVFLKEMVRQKASDMHLTIGQPIVLRISGDIIRIESKILTSELMQSLLLPTFPSRNKEEFANIHDTDYAYELSGIGRFRMNAFRDRNGVGAVLRHIPSEILSAEILKLPPAIMNLCKLNKGLVLVTGPTGSGKSTTLAAMIDWINRNRKEHILTIEDPIEFVHTQQQCLVNQREVHKHTGSFSRALKAALREDPDVILIGEMRDLETISIAIETAETGHLVFGTLHTTTAMSTVDRIIDQFPADRQAQIRTMLASSLRGVVTQTLLKKKGGGRCAAHEILICNDAVASMVREGKIYMIANHMMTQKAEGNQLLNESLFKLIADGLVDPQEALFKAVDKNDFVLTASRRNVKLAG
jgi:twitching motility protein PilT